MICAWDAVCTPQRTQRSRDKSTPTAAADSGSRVSDTSIQAHTFSACVIWARKESAKRSSPGAFGTDDLGDGSQRKAAFQQFIDGLNARSRNRTYGSWRRRKRRRNPVGEVGLDLAAKYGGGRHKVIFALYSPYEVEAVNRASASIAVQITDFSLKRGGLFLQKICDPPQVIQEDFGIPLPVFVCPGPEDGRRMQRGNDRRKAVSLLNLAMRLSDLEA